MVHKKKRINLFTKHLQFSSFREQLLKKYLEEKDYHKLIEVAKEGELQDQQYPGLVKDWEKISIRSLQIPFIKRRTAKISQGTVTWWRL